MPGTDPFLSYVENTREGVDLKKALDNRKQELADLDLRWTDAQGTPLTKLPEPPAPPRMADEGDFGANAPSKKYWNPKGGISDTPTFGPSISTLGKGALDVVPSHVAKKRMMSGKYLTPEEETTFMESVGKGLETVPSFLKQSLAGLVKFTGDTGMASAVAGPEEGSQDPNWQAQVAGQEMFREGRKETQATLPDVEPGSLKAHVYGAAQSLGLSTAAFATGILTGSTLPLLALAGVSGAQEFGAQREGGSDVPTAILGAVVNGLAEYWGERLPFTAWMKAPGFFEKMVASSLLDSVGELGTQTVQSAVQKLTYEPGMTWDDFTATMKDTLIQSLMAGGVQTGAIGAGQAAIQATQRTDVGATDFKGYVEQNFEGAKVAVTEFGANVTLPSGRSVEIHTATSPIAGELQKQALKMGDPKSSARVRSGEEVLSGVYFKSGSLVGTESDLIYLTGQADLTTLPHEKGHLIVSVLQDVLAPEERAAIGLPEEGQISLDTEEAVMDAFEEYAYKRTPSIENPMSPLDKAFQKVIDFAHGVYSAFGGTTQRQVFEEMRTGKILQREGKHIGEFLGRGIVTGEIIPATNSDLTEWIHEQDFGVKQGYSEHVTNKVLFDESGGNVILSRILSPPGRTLPGIGTFEGAVNPNIITKIRPKDFSPEMANLYADLFGYIFTQNAVPWYRADPNLLGVEGKTQGYAVARLDGPITASHVRSFYDILKSRIPGGELTFLGDEIHVVNFMGIDQAEFDAKILEVASEWAKKNDIETKDWQFGTEGDYRTSDAEGAGRWTGDAYKGRIIASGSLALFEWADRQRASALEAAREYSEQVAPPGAKFQGKKRIESRTVITLTDKKGRDITPAVKVALSGMGEPIRNILSSDRIWLTFDGKAVGVPYIHQSEADNAIALATSEPIGRRIHYEEFGAATQSIRFHGDQGDQWRLTGDRSTSLNFEVFAPITDAQMAIIERSVGRGGKILVDISTHEGVGITYVQGMGPAAIQTLKDTVHKAYIEGAKFQTKTVNTPIGEFPLEHNGWKFEGEMMGLYQYSKILPDSPLKATFYVKTPDQVEARAALKEKEFAAPKLQTRRVPGPKGLTVNFTDTEVNALSEELLRGAFEKLQFTQTNDVSMQKAQDLIRAGKMNLDTFLNHDPYTAWPDTATQVAAEMIAGGVFDYVKGRIADWRAGNITADEARQARMVGMGAIASWYLPQSEVGRMLQARQMAISPEGVPIRDLMEEQMKFEKDLQEMIDRGLVTPEEELEAIDKFYSVDQAMNFRKRVAKAKDVSILNQLFYFSLLSNPVTQAANIIGNVGPLFFAIADQYVSEKNPFGSTPKGGTAGMMAGLYHSVLDAFILSGRAAYTGETSMGSDKFRNPRVTGIESVDQARDAIKQIMADKTHPFHDPQSSEYATAKRDVMQLHRKAFNPISGERMARITSGAIDSDSPLARTLDVLGEMIDAPFKGLAAGDEFFKVLNHRMYVWKSAYEMATEKGLEGKAFNEFVAEFVDDPPSTVEALAQDFAAKQTFTSELGPIAEVFQSWNREYPLFRVIVPFVTVIGNIAKYNMEHTPFAYAFRQVRADIKSGGKARDMALSKMAVGSSMMLAFAGLAAAGLITGGGPSDPKLKKLWSQKDRNGNVAWQEYSIKIGGQWISYKRIEPFATPIGVAADIVEILKFAPRVNIAEAMIGGAIAFTRNFTSKTYAQGISNFLEAITSGGGDTMQSNAARWGKSTLGMLIPGGVAQVARVLDPRVKDTHDWIDSLKARVPGLSPSLEPARNLKGDVMTVGMYESIPGKGLGMVNPLMYAGTTGDVVTKEILRNRVPLTMPSRSLGGGRNPDTAMFDEGNTAISLTPAQYGWFVRMAGNGLKDPKTGRGMWDTLTAIINGMEPVDPGGNRRPRLYYRQKNPDGTPVFTDGPEGGKAAIIEKVVHTYRNKVREMIEKGDVFPEVRNEFITKSVSKKINRVPQIGGAR